MAGSFAMTTMSGCAMPRNRFCNEPLPNQFNGTYSLTSMGGVGSTFLLEWLRHLEQADRQQRECKLGLAPEKALFGPSCDCPALADGGPRRHLVSCHYDDDGIFKHLADPSALNRFPNHRAIFLVGSPMDAVASVFRRRFQCWHLYRLNNCWFTKTERNGLIPCEQPGIQTFRRRYGEEASRCRVPSSGPISTLDEYARTGARADTHTHTHAHAHTHARTHTRTHTHTHTHTRTHTHTHTHAHTHTHTNISF